MRSMTGFGAARSEADGWAASAEVRTVNNKGLKLSLRLNPNEPSLESAIDKTVRRLVRRGTVQLTVSVELTGGAAASTLNIDALTEYVEEARHIASKLDLVPPTDIADLLMLPGVIVTSKDESVDDSAAELVLEVVAQSLDSLNDFRDTEGEAMRVDLERLTGEIREHLGAVTERAPGVVEDYRDRLTDRVADLLRDSEASVPHETIIREVSVFAERADINEEITRLDAHLDQFLKQINSGECEGRKLDFLGQEMFREINTIGSKANDLTISRHVVEMKAAAEKIREMVQNVE